MPILKKVESGLFSQSGSHMLIFQTVKDKSWTRRQGNFSLLVTVKLEGIQTLKVVRSRDVMKKIID